MQSSKKSPAKVLTVFSLVMITITSVDSVRNLPSTALFGSSLIFFFLLAGITFLIPTSLVSAELSTGWPRRGGVYLWVKEAFGEQWGFLAIWFQWIENVIWYPTILSFIAGTIAYLINPQLAQNKYFLVAVILVVFWGLTVLNLLGIKASARFSIICGFLGLVIPMLTIIGLGVAWVLMGHHLQTSFDMHHLMPNFHDPSILVAMTGVILCLCGMEITSVHAAEVKNPQRDYPRALLISTVVILLTLILGSLSIAVIVPHDKISLVSGLMQAFNRFLVGDHISWLMPVIAFLTLMGGLGGLSNWIIAPSKGLMVALSEIDMLRPIQKENANGAPSTLLIVQAVIVSVIAMLFIFMPSINSSYWLLTVLAAQLYMIMYVLLFAAAIYMRYKHPDVERAYQIPGGLPGIWCVAGLGILSSLFTIFIGFFPPQGIQIGSLAEYEVILTTGLVILCAAPVIFYNMKPKKHRAMAVEMIKT